MTYHYTAPAIDNPAVPEHEVTVPDPDSGREGKGRRRRV